MRKGGAERAGKRQRVGEQMHFGEVESSDDEGGGGRGAGGDNEYASSDDGGGGVDETADEKRLRLAQEYLATMDRSVGGRGSGDGGAGAGADYDDDSSDLDTDDSGEVNGGDRLGVALHKAALKKAGRLFRVVADDVGDRLAEDPEFGEAGARGADDDDGEGEGFGAVRRAYRGHQLSVTCVALADDEATAWSGSKDCSVLQHDLETGARSTLIGRDGVVAGGPQEKIEHQRQAEVLALAVSSDGTLLASGGRDHIVRIFDTRVGKQVESFDGHRDDVTSIAFRPLSKTLFTASSDRTVKHWDLNEMAYIETLYGHQAEIIGVDRCVIFPFLLARLLCGCCCAHMKLTAPPCRRSAAPSR
jgi:ribosomal RNA-processing protein 9